MNPKLLCVFLSLVVLLSGISNAYAEESVVWFIGAPLPLSYWGGDMVSRAIMRETGISVQIFMADEDPRQMLNILIMSGKTPELITLPRDDWQIEQLIRQNCVWDLDMLAKQNGFNMDTLLDTRIASINRDAKGKLYLCPGMVCTEEKEAVCDTADLMCMLIRKDLLEQDFLVETTTTAGFISTLENIRSYGVSIPLGLMPFNDEGCISIDDYLREALGYPLIGNGTYVDWISKIDSQEWLYTLAEANQKGLLDADVFTANLSKIAEDLSTGAYGIFIGDASRLAYALQLARNAGYEYVVAEHPRGRSPACFSLRMMNYGLYATMIGKECTSPNVAMRLMAFLLSDRGQELVKVGVNSNGKSIFSSQDTNNLFPLALYCQNLRQYQTVYGGASQYGMLLQRKLQDVETPFSLEVLAEAKKMKQQFGHDNSEERRLLLQAKHDAPIEYFLTQHHWGKVLPELLSAPNRESFDRTLAAYVTERQNDGYEEWVQAMEQALR